MDEIHASSTSRLKLKMKNRIHKLLISTFVQVRGRLLTLKLKIRAKDAPVETAKFMGHGVCDSISRSTTLAVATRDPKVIDKEVMLLLRQLKGEYFSICYMLSRLTDFCTDSELYRCARHGYSAEQTSA